MRVLFFFQAEDGIRDKLVTGVQTCALPILPSPPQAMTRPRPSLAARPAISVAWPGPVVSARSEWMPPAAKYGAPYRACDGGRFRRRRRWDCATAERCANLRSPLFQVFADKRRNTFPQGIKPIDSMR